MQNDEPPKLDYLGLLPQQEFGTNIPAAMSLGCGLGAVAFMISLCAGVWPRVAPGVAAHAGWIAGAMALSAIINGAVGALYAPRDSGWYNAALLGYAIGVFVATLSPIFFLL